MMATRFVMRRGEGWEVEAEALPLPFARGGAVAPCGWVALLLDFEAEAEAAMLVDAILTATAALLESEELVVRKKAVIVLVVASLSVSSSPSYLAATINGRRLA